MKKTMRPVLAVLCIIFLIIVAFSGWKVYSILHGYKAAEKRYDSLAGSVIASAASGKDETAAPSPASQSDGKPPVYQPENTSPPLETSPVSVDFDELSRYGGRVIGWIYLPDTVISYPVAQSSDNEFYLERFLDGTPISGGTLFADYICPSDFSGRNTIIYGHNMKDGSMFALVDDYSDQNFYEEHPVMYLNTPSQNYRVDIFSGFTTDPESFVYATTFSSDEDYTSFLRSLVASSEIKCDIEPSSNDRIITLSTCTYSGADVRFVVCGILREIG